MVKKFILDLLFPKFCFLCKREGSYLCRDCLATFEISGFHQKHKTQYLSDLYYPSNYQNHFIKKLIQNFKYEPFIKELAQPLSSLIIEHFQLMENQPNFKDFILVPIPLDKKRLKWRGFNQAEEIAKELSKFFKIPLFNNILIKIKGTLPQVDLSEKERRENVKNNFLVKNKNLIQNKKILLIDDVYTTGSTMEECARVLKQPTEDGCPGAKEIIGIVVARATPGEDGLRNV